MSKPIDEMIAEYEREIMKLQERIGALRELRARTGGAPVMDAAPVARKRVPRGDLKTKVLSLLKERGAIGLNAAIAADITAKRGDPMDRNSVSSLLSRLKTDGIVAHEGGLYRLIGIKDALETERVH